MQRNRSVTELRQICKEQSPPLVTSGRKCQILERLRVRLFPAPSQNNLPRAGSTSGEPVAIAAFKKAAKDAATALSAVRSLAEESRKVLKSVQAEAKSAGESAAKAAERAAEVEASKGMPGSAARPQAAVNPDDDASVSDYQNEQGMSNILYRQIRLQAVEQRRRDKDAEKSLSNVLHFTKDVLMIGKHILLSLSWN